MKIRAVLRREDHSLARLGIDDGLNQVQSVAFAV